MAWEKRRRGKFYYRSRRVDGRVVKEYVGKGCTAESAAKRDAEARAKQEAVRAVERHARRVDERAVSVLEMFAERCDTLLAGTLLVAGYHNHHGEWRRRRGK